MGAEGEPVSSCCSKTTARVCRVLISSGSDGR
jgi:hypothetical protein